MKHKSLLIYLLILLLSIPYLLFIVMMVYLSFNLGKILAYTNIVLSSNTNCAFVNSNTAHIIHVFNNKANCVFILTNKKHIRYIYVINCTISTVDPACGTSCDNLTYQVWYSCVYNNRIYTIPQGIYTGYQFYNILKKELEKVCHK